MQSSDRIFTILNILAASPAFGMRLSDLSRKSGLDKATTSRILKALSNSRVVQKTSTPGTEDSKLYQLGSQLVFLGMAAQRTFTLDDILRPALQGLAEKTGDSCFITIRSGYHSFCILREIGSYPIQIRSLPVGGCRPLGVGGCGVAILAALSEEEAEEILKKNAKHYTAYPRISTISLHEDIKQSRNLGFSFTRNHLIEGVYCIAQAVCDGQNMPIFSVGVVSVASRIEARLTTLVKAVNDACAEMKSILKTTRETLNPIKNLRRINEDSQLFL